GPSVSQERARASRGARAPAASAATAAGSVYASTTVTPAAASQLHVAPRAAADASTPYSTRRCASPATTKNGTASVSVAASHGVDAAAIAAPTTIAATPVTSSPT